MARVAILVGSSVVSLILAIGWLVYFSSDSALDTLESFACNEGETLIHYEGTQDERTRNTYGEGFYCRDAGGNERSVTGNVTLITIGGFVFFLLDSLTMFFIAMRFYVKQRDQAYASYTPPLNTDDQLATMRQLVDQGVMTEAQYAEIERNLRKHN